MGRELRTKYLFFSRKKKKPKYVRFDSWVIVYVIYRLPTPNDQNLEKPADYRPPVPPHRTQLNADDDDDEQAPPPPKRHHHHHHHHRNRSQGMCGVSHRDLMRDGFSLFHCCFYFLSSTARVQRVSVKRYFFCSIYV